MGLTRHKTRRLLAVTSGATVLLLTSCSSQTIDQWKRFGLPPSTTNHAVTTQNLWNGAWTAALIVGALVWFLILFAVFRYWRRSNETPPQNRYNLPMEVLYTVVPFMIVGVLFYFTVVAQNKVVAQVPKPQHTINVVAQKWSWTFNYNEAGNPAVGNDVWQAGTIQHTPDLYLPVGESVRFNLRSVDVIHSFWVPSFHYKLDVIPGRHNYFDATPIREGVFPGKCAELCGTYHSAMLFNVHVVPVAQYNAHLKSLADHGQIGEAIGPQ